mgnify:CR=1 FL=1
MSDLKLYRVVVRGTSWSGRYFVRAEDERQAKQFVKAKDPLFHDEVHCTIRVEVQDDSKGVLFGD